MSDEPLIESVSGAIVDPIGVDRQQQVIAQSELYIRRAASVLNISLKTIPVLFDLKGQAAGMYHVHGSRRWIRYNPYLFAKYFDDNLATTVPHEVAHYAIDIAYGLSRVAPHGPEWKQLMAGLGADSARTSSYDLSGIPIRRHRKYRYRCECDIHELGIRRHNSVQRQRAQYYCRQCKQVLEAVKAE